MNLTNLIILSINLVTNRQESGWVQQQNAFVNLQTITALQIVKIGYLENSGQTNPAPIELGAFVRPLWTNQNVVSVPITMAVVAPSAAAAPAPPPAPAKPAPWREAAGVFDPALELRPKDVEK